MTSISEAAGHVIAHDIATAFHTTDAALLHNARLTSSVLEGTQSSNLNPRAKQKLLEAISAGFSRMLEGRMEMIRAHGQMISIQRNSNLETVDFGCLGAPAFMNDMSNESAPAYAESERH